VTKHSEKEPSRLEEMEQAQTRSAHDAETERPVFEPLPQDKSSGVSAFLGTWPGDETDAELLAVLDEIDD
jgi:hypothetical protein